MTTPEEKKIDELDKFIRKFAREQTEFNSKVEKEINSVVRGLYGDARNNQKGLIHAQQQDEKQFNEIDVRLLAVEKAQYKQFILLSVGAAIVVGCVELVTKMFFK